MYENNLDRNNIIVCKPIRKDGQRNEDTDSGSLKMEVVVAIGIKDGRISRRR